MALVNNPYINQKTLDYSAKRIAENLTFNHNFTPNHMGTEAETQAWFETIKQEVVKQLTPFVAHDRLPSFESCSYNLFSTENHAIYTLIINLEHDEYPFCTDDQWVSLKQELIKVMDTLTDDIMAENQTVTNYCTKHGENNYEYHIYVSAVQYF